MKENEDGKRNTGGDSGSNPGGNPSSLPFAVDADGNLTSIGDPGTDNFRTDSDDSIGAGNLFRSPGDAFGTRDFGGSDPDAGAGPRKRRGRPPGSGRKPGNGSGAASAKKIQTSLEGIEGILLSIHAMGAAALKIPELNLSEEEAAKLTAAINRVAVLYDFGASEKTLAWVNLAICVGGLYGTRLVAYNARSKKEEKEGKKEVTQKAAPIVFPNFA